MANRNDAKIDARTSNKIAGMSEEARSDLARQLNDAGYETVSPHRRGSDPVRREPAPRDRTGRRYRAGDADDEKVAQVSASLHRTERRIKMNADKMSQGRQVRLGKRAKRLKRQLGRLK